MKKFFAEVWAITKVVLAILGFLLFISCSYYLDKLRF